MIISLQPSKSLISRDKVGLASFLLRLLRLRPEIKCRILN